MAMILFRNINLLSLIQTRFHSICLNLKKSGLAYLCKCSDSSGGWLGLLSSFCRLSLGVLNQKSHDEGISFFKLIWFKFETSYWWTLLTSIHTVICGKWSLWYGTLYCHVECGIASCPGELLWSQPGP